MGHGMITLQVRVGTYTQNACLSSNKVSTFPPMRLLEKSLLCAASPNVLRGIHTTPFYGDLIVVLMHLCSHFVVERIGNIYKFSIASFGWFSLSITCIADKKVVVELNAM